LNIETGNRRLNIGGWYVFARRKGLSVRDIEFTYFYNFSIECWDCSDSVIYMFSFYYKLWKKPAELQLLKENMVLIFLRDRDIFSYLYITFTISYYNTSSRKCTISSYSLKDFIKQNHTIRLYFILTILITEEDHNHIFF
jgi:hypothetical protein